MTVTAGHLPARSILDAVRHFCQENRLFSPGPLVVAVSGGADSVCLLDLLRTLAPRFGLTLHVAHFNHGLRGEAAEADARFVAELADHWQLACTLGSGDVAALARRGRRSLEAAAHDLRWAFLRDVRQRAGATAIATGHTRDDQAETLLMHLLRGSGLAGLSGLAPAAASVVRPLLSIAHEDAVAWCRQQGLAWREDASNAEPWCRRNVVRLEVLPFLRRYNPALERTLARTAEGLQSDLAYLDQQATAALASLVSPGPGAAPRLDLAGYRDLPSALRRHLLRRWLGEAGRAELLRAAEALLLGGRSGDSLSLPGGRRLVLEYGQAVLQTGAAPSPPAVVPLAVPGCTDAPDWGWSVQTAVVDGPLPPPADPWTAHLDPGRIGLPLLLRPRHPGDRIQLAGMPAGKKLQDIFVDAKIPRRERDRVGVVAATNGIVWLAGWRVAAWAAAGPESKQVLSITVRNLTPPSPYPTR